MDGFIYTACVSRDRENIAVTIWRYGRPVSSDMFHESEGAEAVYAWMDSILLAAMLGFRFA